MSAISKGIGIGIGVVFGIIIAFILIGFFVGFITFTSNKEQTPTGAVAGVSKWEYEPVQEIKKITQNAQEEIKEVQEELVGKNAEESNKEDIFKNSKAKNTQNGITLSLDDFTVEDKGDWVKITNIKVTILNEGSKSFTPNVIVKFWDDNTKQSEKYSTRATIESDGWIDNGNYKSIEGPVNIGFKRFELEKTMKLSLVDAWDWDPNTLVSVEYKFMPEKEPIIIESLGTISEETTNSKYICDYNAYNCDDFNTHAEAQAVYELCGGVSKDVHGLDRDKDELACESLP